MATRDGPTTRLAAAAGRPAGRAPSRWRLSALVGAGLVVAGGLALGPGGGAGAWCLSAAATRTAADRWHAARGWLDRAAWWLPGDPRVALGRAALARRQGHADAWAEALDAARRGNAEPALVDRERSLAALWSGADSDGLDRRMDRLAAAGVPAAEIAAGAVVGSLARGDRPRAAHLLAAITGEQADRPLVDLLAARIAADERAFAVAERLLRTLLGGHPTNDAAHEALVDVLAGDGRPDDALAAAGDWLARSPGEPTALVAASRLLRRAGRADEALAILGAAGSSPPPFVVRERAEVTLETGDAAAALAGIVAPPTTGRESRQAPWESRGTALGLAGEPTAADHVFRTADARRSGRTASPDVAADDPFARHCGACHAAGDEPRGRAAPDLFPPPRDFRRDAFRLVSGPDGQPTAADVAAVIRDGIPGASMPAFPRLDAAVVDRLVAAVLAARPSPRGAARSTTLPGAAELAAGDAARGRAEYAAAGCGTCHGPDGRPQAPRALFDEHGVPNPPRDLVHDPFKGGRTRTAVAARLALGMPGSAHPAVDLPPDRLADLVAWVVSLEGNPRAQRGNHDRLRDADPVPSGQPAAEPRPAAAGRPATATGPSASIGPFSRTAPSAPAP